MTQRVKQKAYFAWHHAATCWLTASQLPAGFMGKAIWPSGSLAIRGRQWASQYVQFPPSSTAHAKAPVTPLKTEPAQGVKGPSRRPSSQLQASRDQAENELITQMGRLLLRQSDYLARIQADHAPVHIMIRRSKARGMLAAMCCRILMFWWSFGPL